MQIVEVMVAAVVFTTASASSLQIWSHAASSTQLAVRGEELLERIELDRLQLQAHWRRDLEAAAACGISGDALISVASAVPVPPQLQREVWPGPDADAVRVRWRIETDPSLQRERVFTLAGLGLSCAEAPRSSQLEEQVHP